MTDFHWFIFQFGASSLLNWHWFSCLFLLFSPVLLWLSFSWIAVAWSVRIRSRRCVKAIRSLSLSSGTRNGNKRWLVKTLNLDLASSSKLNLYLELGPNYLNFITGFFLDLSRPSYVVPTSLFHGIKLVNPMFRGYAQQVCEAVLFSIIYILL